MNTVGRYTVKVYGVEYALGEAAACVGGMSGRAMFGNVVKITPTQITLEMPAPALPPNSKPFTRRFLTSNGREVGGGRWGLRLVSYDEGMRQKRSRALEMERTQATALLKQVAEESSRWRAGQLALVLNAIQEAVGVVDQQLAGGILRCADKLKSMVEEG